ncbi:MAG: hypothetical protein AB7O24_17795 [Kofleriaceae bacterium]
MATLVGDWTMQGTHPMLPGRDLRGRATFAWIESGAFLVLRTTNDDPDIPNGVAVFGTDDATNVGRMLYFDVRNVSREYEWSIAGRVWTWSRNDPAFSQRMDMTIGEDGRTIAATGQMSRNGAPWEPDIQLTYTRAR